MPAFTCERRSEVVFGATAAAVVVGAASRGGGRGLGGLRGRSLAAGDGGEGAEREREHEGGTKKAHGSRSNTSGDVRGKFWPEKASAQSVPGRGDRGRRSRSRLARA